MSKWTKKHTVAAVIVVVIVIAVVIAILASNDHAAAPTTTQSTDGVPTAATTSASYTSPNDGFAVNFAESPQVTNTTFDSPTAGEIPMTEYKAAASGGTPNAYEAVFVYHYPASYTFSADYLSGALTEFNASVGAKYPGTTIISQTTTQFLGASALSATITIPDAGDMYLVATTNGQDAYIIGTYGLSEGEYNSFVNSFTFTQ